MTSGKAIEDPVAFLGDSLTAEGDWAAMFPALLVRNFGISGDTSDGVLGRLDAVMEVMPARLVLLIGTNDLGLDREPAHIAANVEEIVSRLQGVVPPDRILLQGLLPREAVFHAAILELNARLERIAEAHGLAFIDLHAPFLVGERLDPTVTEDGLHLVAAGYDRWHKILAPYLSDG